MDAITSTPAPRNEPVRAYGPKSRERDELIRKLTELAGERAALTMTIGGVQRMAGGAPFQVVAPHRHAHILGHSAQATATDVADAVRAAVAPLAHGRPVAVFVDDIDRPDAAPVA